MACPVVVNVDVVPAVVNVGVVVMGTVVVVGVVLLAVAAVFEGLTFGAVRSAMSSVRPQLSSCAIVTRPLSISCNGRALLSWHR